MNATPALTSLLAYLLGCFNTGYYLVRGRTGEDVRALGSGNAGATNAWRALGVWGFGVALAGDVGKGVLAVLLARWLTGGDGWATVLAVPAVVAGHIWPVQLGFRGGEGFATALGALATLDPPFTAVIAGMALVLILATRKRSLTGLGALLAAPVVTVWMGRPTSQLIALLMVISMMLWAFRRHIRSLFHREPEG